MKNIFIITGANRGLGKAIIDNISKRKDIYMISLSRSVSKDHLNLENFDFVLTDLLDEFSPVFSRTIDKYLSNDTKIIYVNNASIINPIGSIGTFKETEIENSIKVNIEYPILLVNHLMNKYINNEKVFVNISSGAGINSISGWSLYGASKSYLNLFFNVLDKESDNMVEVISIDPGVIDTGMQENIRKSDFPQKEYFCSLKDDGALKTPEFIASKILKQISFI